jgi:hypothetical protein
MIKRFLWIGDTPEWAKAVGLWLLRIVTFGFAAAVVGLCGMGIGILGRWLVPGQAAWQWLGEGSIDLFLIGNGTVVLVMAVMTGQSVVDTFRGIR